MSPGSAVRSTWRLPLSQADRVIDHARRDLMEGDETHKTYHVVFDTVGKLLCSQVIEPRKDAGAQLNVSRDFRPNRRIELTRASGR